MGAALLGLRERRGLVYMGAARPSGAQGHKHGHKYALGRQNGLASYYLAAAIGYTKYKTSTEKGQTSN
jgi:hypothetical protein